MAITVAQLTARVTADVDDAVAGLTRVDRALHSTSKAAQETTKTHDAFGGTLASVGKMAAGFGAAQIGLATGQAALTTAIGGTIGVAMKFQQELANVGAATGATKDQMAAMRVEALKIGADTSKSASEAATAMGELTKAGVSVKDAVGGVARTVVQMSEATGASVSDMATLVSNGLNTFGLAASEANNVANTIVKTANASAIGVGDFAQSLQAVGPVAKLAGLSMEDMSTAIGILGNNALKGSDAGTSLKTMLTSLAAPSSTAAAEMKRLGVHLYDAQGAVLPFREVLTQLQGALGGATDAQKAQSLQTLFGSDAIRAGTILLKEGTAGWDGFKRTMATAPDIAAQSEARLHTLSGQVEVLKGSLETMGIAIGTQALPALTSLAEKATTVVNALQTKEGQTGVLAQLLGLGGAATGAGGAEKKAEGLMMVLDALGKAKDLAPQVGDAIRAIFTGVEEPATKFTTTIDGAGLAMDGAGHVAGDYAAIIAGMGTTTGEAAGATKAMQTALEGAGGASGRLDPLQQKLQELFGDAEKVSKALNDITNPPTGVEAQVGAQLSSIEAGMKAVALATRIGGDENQYWTSQAGQMFSAAGLTGAELTKVGSILTAVAHGTISSADATKILDDALKGSVGTKKAIVDAEGAVRKAYGDTAQAGLEQGRSLEQIRAKANEVVDVFHGRFPEIPAAAQSAAAGVKEAFAFDASSLGAAVGAGYAAGIASQAGAIYGSAATAARQAKHAMAAEMGISSPSKVAMELGEYVGEGFELGMKRKVRDVAATAGELGQAAADGIGEATTMIGPASSAFLTAWSGAFNTAQLAAQFGQQGGALMQAMTTAIEAGTPQAGQSAYAAAQRVIEQMKAARLAGGDELGASLMMSVTAAIQTGTPDAVTAAQAAMAQVIAALAQAGTATAASFLGGFNTAQMSARLSAELGSVGASAVSALMTSFETGTAASAEKAGASVSALLEAARKGLPPALFGQLGTDLWAAFTSASEGGGAEAISAFQSTASRINTALAVIPRNFRDMSSTMQGLVQSWSTTLAGMGLSAEEQQRRISAAISIVPKDLATLPAAAAAMYQGFAAEMIATGQSAEDMATRVKAAAADAARATAAMAMAYPAAQSTTGSRSSPGEGDAKTNIATTENYLGITGANRSIGTNERGAQIYDNANIPITINGQTNYYGGGIAPQGVAAAAWGAATNASNVRGYASGGRATGWADVGEHGTERAYFGAPAQIYSAPTSRAMAREDGGMTRVPAAAVAASSAPTVNVTVTVGTVAGAGGLRELASELATHIDRHLGKQAQLAGAMRGGS